MREDWREIDGYDGYYEVSSMGRVRSWVRLGWHGKSKKPRLLKTGPGSRGYPQVTLHLDNAQKSFRVHRLVAEVFLDKPRNGKCMVLHKDDNKLNNNVDNLYWGDYYDNARDRAKNGIGVNINVGESNYNAVLNKDDVIEIRELYGQGQTQQSIADEFGVTQSSIGRIVRNEAWSHI